MEAVSGRAGGREGVATMGLHRRLLLHGFTRWRRNACLLKTFRPEKHHESLWDGHEYFIGEYLHQAPGQVAAPPSAMGGFVGPTKGSSEGTENRHSHICSQDTEV